MLNNAAAYLIGYGRKHAKLWTKHVFMMGKISIKKKEKKRKVEFNPTTSNSCNGTHLHLSYELFVSIAFSQ